MENRDFEVVEVEHVFIIGIRTKVVVRGAELVVQKCFNESR
jgi:hypothetical protein